MSRTRYWANTNPWSLNAKQILDTDIHTLTDTLSGTRAGIEPNQPWAMLFCYNGFSGMTGKRAIWPQDSAESSSCKRRVKEHGVYNEDAILLFRQLSWMAWKGKQWSGTHESIRHRSEQKGNSVGVDVHVGILDHPTLDLNGTGNKSCWEVERRSSTSEEHIWSLEKGGRQEKEREEEISRSSHRDTREKTVLCKSVTI